jgi:septin family protein
MLETVSLIIHQRGLGGTSDLATKVMQLHEVLNIRFGVMLVGAAGVGKTTIYRILKSAMVHIL